MPDGNMKEGSECVTVPAPTTAPGTLTISRMTSSAAGVRIVT
jgi:hypothetical protein